MLVTISLIIFGALNMIILIIPKMQILFLIE